MKFKKGDLVRVYGNMGKGIAGRELPRREADYYSSEGWIGRIIDRVYCSTEVNVRLSKHITAPKGAIVTVHPKQCRHFKPKAAK